MFETNWDINYVVVIKQVFTKVRRIRAIFSKIKKNGTFLMSIVSLKA